MPASGKTTPAKRYWIRVVTAVLGVMPKNFKHQDVIDYMEKRVDRYSIRMPADSTIKAYIKEILDSPAEVDWMDDSWNMGAISKLGLLSFKLDAHDLRAISDVAGYALIYETPISIRQAIWIARLREFVFKPIESSTYRLHELATQYANAERASSVLDEPMDTSYQDAKLSMEARPGAKRSWPLSVSVELLVADRSSWNGLAESDVREQVGARDKYQDEHKWGEGPTDFMEDVQLIFDDSGLQDIFVLAVTAFKRSEKAKNLQWKKMQDAVREIYGLIEKGIWSDLWDFLDHVEINERVNPEYRRDDGRPW